MSHCPSRWPESEVRRAGGEVFAEIKIELIPPFTVTGSLHCGWTLEGKLLHDLSAVCALILRVLEPQSSSGAFSLKVMLL